MYQLKQNGKVIFKSDRKLDVTFEHQKYHRRDRVTLHEPHGNKH